MVAEKEIIENVFQLIHLYKNGCLGGEEMPEDCLIGAVAEEDLLNVLTLAMALNYQRNSHSLWRAVLATYQDKELKWVFDPETVSNAENLSIKHALLKHKVALQPNKHPEIWQRVAAGICVANPSGNVSSFLQSMDYDIQNLIETMQKTRKKDFPYLSGPKIFNYWLYALESYGNVTWKNRHLITIAPDTHILKATVHLELADSSVLQGSAKDRERVSTLWKELLAETEIAPIDIHTPLWLWSRMGFPEIS